MSLLPTALKYLHSGISLIPCNIKTKAPMVRWQPYINTRPTSSELVRWFRNKDVGIATIAGTVSGGMEVIDFDEKSIFPKWQKMVCSQNNTLLNILPISQTRSGGYHVYYRCESVSSNKKLARGETGETLIETRGNGGYVIAPPSKNYNWINKDITNLPVISQNDRNLLLQSATNFNKIVETKSIIHVTDGVFFENTNKLRPGDLYNLYGDISLILSKHGWQYVGNRGVTEYWRRPGKKEGISATFNHNGCGVFYVFSSNAQPFEINTGYKPFTVYTLLEYNGDFRAAAAKLVEQGFCSQ